MYRRAKSRGTHLVTITDHDQIEGALTIADRPDVIIGCDVTAVFPDDGVSVHLGVLGINVGSPLLGGRGRRSYTWPPRLR